jgi:transcriptional regulator with XRE-family HTH domain
LVMLEMNEAERGPRDLDCQIGIRLRTRRRELGVSQDALAAGVGLTFQQIQKYERGANRVSASKLWEIAAHLQTPISYFYEGLEGIELYDPESLARAEALQDFLLSPDGVDLALAFQSLSAAAVRRQFLDLIRACAAVPASLSSGENASDSAGPANEA